MNVPVLAFSAALSVGTALAFGLVPAWQANRTDLAALKQSARGSLTSSRGALRSGLVIAEVALSLVLLTGAALMLQSLLTLQQVPLGFPPERVLTMRVPLSTERYPDPPRRIAFLRELLDALGAAPGIAAAGISTGLRPFRGQSVPVEVDGGLRDARRVMLQQVSPGYLHAFDRRLVTGRGIEEPDVRAARRVTLVNEAFVRRYLPNRSAVGATVRIPQLRQPPASLDDASFQVAGVLRDAINDDPREGVQPEMFIPYTIIGAADVLVVRAAGDASSLARAVAMQVYKIDKDQPVTDVYTIEALLQRWVLSSPRFNVILLGVFATLGLVLASVGVYGVISTMVAQRTREIGLRMAMGATIRDVLLLVARRGLVLVASGIAIGLVATVAVGRLLASTMESLTVFDVRAFGVVCLVLLGAGGLACFWPAQRAARIEPASALRNE
jgi:predicted permease